MKLTVLVNYCKHNTNLKKNILILDKISKILIKSIDYLFNYYDTSA